MNNSGQQTDAEKLQWLLKSIEFVIMGGGGATVHSQLPHTCLPAGLDNLSPLRPGQTGPRFPATRTADVTAARVSCSPTDRHSPDDTSQQRQSGMRRRCKAEGLERQRRGGEGLELFSGSWPLCWRGPVSAL